MSSLKRRWGSSSKAVCNRGGPNRGPKDYTNVSILHSGSEGPGQGVFQKPFLFRILLPIRSFGPLSTETAQLMTYTGPLGGRLRLDRLQAETLEECHAVGSVDLIKEDEDLRSSAIPRASKRLGCC